MNYRRISHYRSHNLEVLGSSLAGPRFYYSDLRFGVGRCFWFLRKQCVNKLFELLDVYAVIFYETPHHSIRCYIESCINVQLKYFTSFQ